MCLKYEGSEVLGEKRRFSTATVYLILEWIYDLFNEVRYSTVHYNAVKCSTVHYNEVQCSTLHYITVQYTREPQTSFCQIEPGRRLPGWAKTYSGRIKYYLSFQLRERLILKLPTLALLLYLCYPFGNL